MKTFTRTNYFPIGFGILYMVLSLFASGVNKLHAGVLLSNERLSAREIKSATLQYETWSTYLPFFFLLGALYFMFGFVIKKNYKFSIITNSVLIGVSLILFISFQISSYEGFLLTLQKFSNAPRMFYYGSIFAAVWGGIFSIIILCIPGFLILRFLKDDKKVNITTESEN